MEALKEVIETSPRDWVLWIAGLFALFELFRWLYTFLEWLVTKFGFETKKTLEIKEWNKRLSKAETDIDEIKKNSDRNVAMFLEHEQAVVGKFTGIRDERVSTFVGELKKLRDRMDEQQAESEAKSARMRIQRFADELYGNVLHSKEHFDLILMDITAYNNYCDTHPDFLNEKTKFAEEIIRDKYEKCMRERTFRG